MATLSVVIPAYNEEARLPDLIAAIDREADAIATESGFDLLEVLVVDDGSSDRTAEILCQAEAGSGHLSGVLGDGENRGKGAAFAAGVARAGGDYVLLTDVDLSTPLRELPKLAAAIDAGADIAIGSRAIDGAIVERGPAHRKLLGKGFNGTVRLLTGLPDQGHPVRVQVDADDRGRDAAGRSALPRLRIRRRAADAGRPGRAYGGRGSCSLPSRFSLQRQRHLREPADAARRLRSRLPPAPARRRPLLAACSVSSRGFG